MLAFMLTFSPVSLQSLRLLLFPWRGCTPSAGLFATELSACALTSLPLSHRGYWQQSPRGGDVSQRFDRIHGFPSRHFCVTCGPYIGDLFCVLRYLVEAKNTDGQPESANTKRNKTGKDFVFDHRSFVVNLASIPNNKHAFSSGI